MNAFPTADTIGSTIDISMSKAPVLEAVSLTEAAMQDGERRTEPAISNERIALNNVLLGTYKVISDAIPGGMGNVWKVLHESWNTELAMKRPHPRYFAEGGARRKKQFIEECENWIRLGLHPNIVSCYYVRDISSVPTVFSEWMEGGSLRDRILDGTLYNGTDKEISERLLRIALQTALGLAYAHGEGLIHQDIKPGNLLLTKYMDAKVADFGLARSRERLKEENDQLPVSGYTREYCPLEQMESTAAETWMDTYAWALTILEAYAGARRWETGADAKEHLSDYMDNCRVSLTPGMRELIISCITDKIATFNGIVTILEEEYRNSTGRPYPTPAARAASDTADSLNNRALSYMDLGFPDESVGLWERALLLDPDHTDSLFNRELYNVRSGEKYDYAAMHILNSSPSARAIQAAQLIGRECGGIYSDEESDGGAHAEREAAASTSGVARTIIPAGDSFYMLLFEDRDFRNLLGLKRVRRDDGKVTLFDPLTELRRKDEETRPPVDPLTAHLKGTPASAVNCMEIDQDRETAAFSIRDIVCLYDLSGKKILRVSPEVTGGVFESFRLEPSRKRLIVTRKWWKEPGHYTTILDFETMMPLWEGPLSFAGFLPDGETLLRGKSAEGYEEFYMMEDLPEGIHACDEPVEIFRLLRTDGEVRLYPGEDGLLFCWHDEASDSCCRMDQNFESVPMEYRTFDAFGHIYYYDPAEKLVYAGCKGGRLAVWDLETEKCLFTAPNPLSSRSVWDAAAGAFFTPATKTVTKDGDEGREYVTSWRFDPLPVRQEIREKASWRLSRIMTTDRRLEEDFRIARLIKEFSSCAEKGDIGGAIAAYHEACGIEGFPLHQEADTMSRFLDREAVRTGVRTARPVETRPDMPPLSGTKYHIDDCGSGRKAFLRNYNGNQMVIFWENGKLIREVPLPGKIKTAAVRAGRIYVFDSSLQYIEMNLEGKPLIDILGQEFPTPAPEGRKQPVYSIHDLDSEGKYLLITIWDRSVPGRNALYQMDVITKELLRLSDSRDDTACYLRDDRIVLGSEKGLYLLDHEEGRILKELEYPGKDIFEIIPSQERENFCVRSVGCVYLYDMEGKLLGSCDERENDLHFLPGGRMALAGRKIVNLLENRVEWTFTVPSSFANERDGTYAPRRITISPDGREAYMEAYKEYAAGEVTVFEIEYTYGLKERGEEAGPAVRTEKKQGFWASLFGSRKRTGPDRRLEELNRERNRIRQEHAAEDREKTDRLRDPFSGAEQPQRRPPGSRPSIKDRCEFLDLGDGKERLTCTVRIRDVAAWDSDPRMRKAWTTLNARMGKKGRIVMRVVGPLPQLQVFVEAPDRNTCARFMSAFMDELWELGHMQ